MRAVPASIVNVGYRSTNFWVVSAGRSRFLVDLGWMGMFGALEANLRRMDIPLREITHGFATHYHGDHAGAAQDLKLAGMRLVLFDVQLPFVASMAQWMKPADRYTPITLDDNLVIPIAEGRALLATLGLEGEFVHTPGHSDDSVSLLLDDGSAFTGDLTWPGFAEEKDLATVTRSWELLRSKGARRVYAGHGPIRAMP
ncbi:MAG: MBL fold metallo-hydrolase [Gemmatimonadetes bacterium]|nr:MBL fold metallo-hydrolase [Gemmatimonadota bacterium]